MISLTSLAHQAIIEQKVNTPDEVFTSSLYQMDIERVRYSLVKYLRIRIVKIEKSFLSILSNIEMMERLSKEEKVFLTRLSNLQNTFYEETIYNRLSENIKESVESSDDCFKNSQVSLYVSSLLSDQSHLEISFPLPSPFSL